MRCKRPTSVTTVALLLVAVCLPFFPILRVSSQSSATVFVEPSTLSVGTAESFDAIVCLSNVQNLYGLEVILNWDPAVLRVVNVETRLGVETFSDGVLHESPYSPPIFIAENNLTQSRGEYRLVATSIAPAPSFSGSGNIVRITFEPILVGVSKLDLESQLFDYPPEDRNPRTSFPIEHATLGSFVTVKQSILSPSPTLTPSPAPTLTPTPTPTITPTPSSPSETSFLNLRIEHVLATLTTFIVIILIILLAIRRRK